MNSRFDKVKDYVDSKFKELKDYVDKRFDELDKGLREYVDRKVEDLDKRVSARAEKPSARVEHRLLTKEEWEKLKEYLDKSEKDELTLEEADDFLELARKVVKEHGDRPEAWKLHIYATITRALLVKKHYEMEKKEKEQERERQRERQERKQDEPRETSHP
jgi:ribosomal protein S24E